MTLSNYQGEEIIASITIKGGVKYEDRVWMPRTVFNDPAGKDAFIIGNGKSRQQFDLRKLPADTYGCNGLYRDYAPNFLIVVDRYMYSEVKESGYGEKNIVYTNHSSMTKFGGTCHLIPSNPHRGAGPTATHIAIHDGHKNLFMLGFDCAEDTANNNVYVGTKNYNDEKTVVHVTVWGKQIENIMKSNTDVNFTFVEGNQSREIINLPNYKSITYSQFSNYLSNEKT